MSIQIHTFPQGQQLSDGELVQRQVVQAGRLVFKDTYFGELSDGDNYIIPEQATLPLASDTEILDFIVDNKDTVAWTVIDHVDKKTISVFDRSDYKDYAVSTIDAPDGVVSQEAIRGVIREAFTEVIHNRSL